MIGAIVCFLICLLILRQLKKKSKDGFLNMFYVMFYAVELLIAIILIVTDSDYRLYNGLKLSECVGIFGIACVVACIGVYLGQWFSNAMLGTSKGYSLRLRVEGLKKYYNINKVSLFLLCCFIFTIYSSLDVAYIIAVFALSFSFAPAFIGLVWSQLSKFNRLLWIIALGVNFMFHALQGSRGTALFPVIFIIAGYLLSIWQDKKLFRRRVTLFAIIAVVSLPVLSFIQSFREIQGRGIEVNAENLNLLYTVAQDYETTSTTPDRRMHTSLGRMLIEANPAAVAMTPEEVPYRYTDYLVDELISVFSLAGDEGRDANRETRGKAGYGTGVATNYGFAVNEFTSVEWPVFADGFSRFGYFGLFIYSFIFAAFLSLLEKWSQRIWRKNPLMSMILLLFILYNGVLSYMYSYYAFLKLLVFRMTLVACITYVVSLATRRKYVIRATIRGSMARPCSIKSFRK